MMRQTSFSFLKDYKKEFGGSLLSGKRKTRRPLSTKKPIHLILKSTHKGIFNPGNRSLDKLIRSQCEKFGIRIYDLALNWSHVHLLIRIQDRGDYVKFIRSLTSIIAAKIRSFKTECTKIFTLRPFTRIINWGKDFKNTLSYQILNQLEALGFISRKKAPEKSTDRKKNARKN